MIAKLCVHAPTRADALEGMADALDAFDIDGIQHNISFLAAVMGHKKFQSGTFNTGFIAEEFKGGFTGAPLTPEQLKRVAAAAVCVQLRKETRKHKISGQLNGAPVLGHEWVVKAGPQIFNVEAWLEGGKGVNVDFGEGPDAEEMLEVESAWNPGERLFRGRIGGEKVSMLIVERQGGLRINYRGASLNVAVQRPRIAGLANHMLEKKAADTSKFLLCPMPGLVVSINVELGQEVKAGETLAVVEAMKMENVLRAERDGTIKKINAKKGDSLPVDSVILEFA
jgi:propionyl-CoA carboxylase alpha chain